MADGLNKVGLLKPVRKYSDTMSEFFVINNKKLTLDEFTDLLDPKFSEAGSNKYEQEVNVYKYFSDFLEDCYNNGNMLGHIVVLILFS